MDQKQIKEKIQEQLQLLLKCENFEAFTLIQMRIKALLEVYSVFGIHMDEVISRLADGLPGAVEKATCGTSEKNSFVPDDSDGFRCGTGEAVGIPAVYEAELHTFSKKGDVFILDGMEIKGVRFFNVSQKAGELTRLTLVLDLDDCLLDTNS